MDKAGNRLHTEASSEQARQGGPKLLPVDPLGTRTSSGHSCNSTGGQCQPGETSLSCAEG